MQQYIIDLLDKIQNKKLKRVLRADTKEDCLTAFDSEHDLGLPYEEFYDGSGVVNFKLGRWVKYEIPRKDIKHISQYSDTRFINIDKLKGRSYTFEVHINNNGQASYWFCRNNASGGTVGTLTTDELKAVLKIVNSYK